ncbi:hypothetical protein CEK25_000237 [Fusarium fujikuroi]|nr:hypothetical protein CEK25_000237 [Fusarium fujikuroi]
MNHIRSNTLSISVVAADIWLALALQLDMQLEKTKRPKGSLGRKSKRGRSTLAKAPAKIRQEDMKHAD